MSPERHAGPVGVGAVDEIEQLHRFPDEVMVPWGLTGSPTEAAPVNGSARTTGSGMARAEDVADEARDHALGLEVPDDPLAGSRTESPT